jgi:hypothetical protein
LECVQLLSIRLGRYLWTRPGLPDVLMKPFEWKIFIPSMAIWYTLRPFALFYGNLTYVHTCIAAILLYYTNFAIFTYQEKSVNAGHGLTMPKCTYKPTYM